MKINPRWNKKFDSTRNLGDQQRKGKSSLLKGYKRVILLERSILSQASFPIRTFFPAKQEAGLPVNVPKSSSPLPVVGGFPLKICGFN